VTRHASFESLCFPQHQSGPRRISSPTKGSPLLAARARLCWLHPPQPRAAALSPLGEGHIATMGFSELCACGTGRQRCTIHAGVMPSSAPLPATVDGAEIELALLLVR
jgi:hypothetical protein